MPKFRVSGANSSIQDNLWRFQFLGIAQIASGSFRMSNKAFSEHSHDEGINNQLFSEGELIQNPFHDQEIATNRVDDSPTAEDELPEINRRKKPNLSPHQRMGIYQLLICREKRDQPGKLQRGTIKEVAAQYGVQPDTISLIWKRGQQSKADGHVAACVKPRMEGRVGRNKIPIDAEKIKSIPLRLRQNIRTMAQQLGTSRSTLHDRIKEGLIKPHSNAIKPFLNDANKIARLEFAISMLDPLKPDMFQDMMDRVHIDEKWFFITITNNRYYLADGEEPPHRTCKRMKIDGSNAYKVPHVGKASLLRRGDLPECLRCPVEVIQRARGVISRSKESNSS